MVGSPRVGRGEISVLLIHLRDSTALDASEAVF
jgi:hypothetical protein